MKEINQYYILEYNYNCEIIKDTVTKNNNQANNYSKHEKFNYQK